MVDGNEVNPYGVNEAPHGTIEKVWYPSPTLGMDRRMYIYTPPGYRHSMRNYPVLYLLHGGGGDEESWTSQGRTPEIMDRLIVAGKAKPMIVVMTNGNPGMAAAPGEMHVVTTRSALDKPPNMGSGKFEESLVKDVMPFIQKNYRIIIHKDSHAIAGYSLGGLQTMYLSNHYPGLFSYYGVMSMGVADMSRYGVQVDINAQEANIRKLKSSNPKLFWIACGNKDFLYRGVMELLKFLDSQNFTYIFRDSEGGHTWENWSLYLYDFTQMLFK